MKVRDLMQRAVPTIRENETLDCARQLMASADVRHLPVRGANGDGIVGVLSQRDLLRAASSPARAVNFARSVRDFMSAPVEHVTPDAELAEAAATLLEKRIGCLPVLQGGALVGLITPADVLRDGSPVPDASSRARARPGETPVSRIMYAAPIRARERDTVVETAARMVRDSVRHACVVDAEDCVVGMISDRDVRRVLGDARIALVPAHVPEHLHRLTVGHIMTLKPRCIDSDAPLSRALSMLVTQHHVGALPVVDSHGRLRGIVSYVDVLKQLASDLEGSATALA